MTDVSLSPSVWQPTVDRVSARSAVVVWLPTLAGCGLFAIAAISRSMPLTNAGAIVTTAALAWVPVALALQRRLTMIGRAQLVLGAIFLVQAIHTVEHVVQIIESFRLDYPPARSLGVVSKLNVEWVHFGWNWIATAGVFVTFVLGVRTWAMALLMAWITAHSLEHTYMLVRYFRITGELDRLGVPRLGSSEVLPGVLGRDGWLALHAPFLRGWLGPLTAAPRVAIHLWWNVGEVALLLLALRVKVRRRTVDQRDARSA
jgi:hypothetical protein